MVSETLVMEQWFSQTLDFRLQNPDRKNNSWVWQVHGCISSAEDKDKGRSLGLNGQ